MEKVSPARLLVHGVQESLSYIESSACSMHSVKCWNIVDLKSHLWGCVHGTLALSSPFDVFSASILVPPFLL